MISLCRYKYGMGLLVAFKRIPDALEIPIPTIEQIIAGADIVWLQTVIYQVAQ